MKSVLQSIMDNKINVYKNIYNRKINRKTIEIRRRQRGKVVLIWTPAYIGVRRNEIAS